VQSKDYTICDSAPGVCRIHNVDQVLDQQLTRPEEPEDDDDRISEHKAMFQDALKGMEAARKYMYQCDTEN
jgi:hypothetical protein